MEIKKSEENQKGQEPFSVAFIREYKFMKSKRMEIIRILLVLHTTQKADARPHALNY